MLKGEKFAWTLQKATELGAAAITPVVSERTIAAEGDLTEGKGERWSRIVREAAEQCRAARLPALGRPLPWAAAVSGGQQAQVAIMPREAAPAGGPGAGAAAARQAGSVSPFIRARRRAHGRGSRAGAGGGRAGREPGPRILRAETAAVAMLAALLLPL